MIRPEKLAEQFILTDDDLGGFEALSAASLDAFQRAGEAIAAALGELIEASRAVQGDFTLTDGSSQNDNETATPLESKELPHE